MHRPADDLAACARLLCAGSRTFYLASFLLPGRVRDAAIALYAFCRVADDDIDLGGDAAALLALEARLARVYAGRPDNRATDRAFARVVDRYDIPRALPEALFEGLRWDLDGRRYETLGEIEDYAARVAGSVGVMMAMLMQVRAPALLARAADLGVAMQLTNIARDVGEDARTGRLYLPRQWLREAGLDPEVWLQTPRHSAALGGVVLRLLARAEELYGLADAGIAGLPVDCRFGIGAARHCYAAIGHEVARRGGNAVDGRAVVSGARKCARLARALPLPWPSTIGIHDMPLPATRYLVDAAQAAGAWHTPNTERPPGREVPAIIELLERLERRDRAARAQTIVGG